MIAASLVGIFNVILLSSLRSYIPQLFTNDQDVINLVAQVLPICAAFQLFDALAANCNGLLRGLGSQHVGGWVYVNSILTSFPAYSMVKEKNADLWTFRNLFCYYVVAMPISFGTAFGLHWELEGLWSGVAIALGL